MAGPLKKQRPWLLLPAMAVGWIVGDQLSAHCGPACGAIGIAVIVGLAILATVVVNTVRLRRSTRSPSDPS